MFVYLDPMKKPILVGGVMCAACGLFGVVGPANLTC